MNLLLQDSKFVDIYTYLPPLFQAAPELCEFTYLISELEVGFCTDERLMRSSTVISGHELKKVVDGEEVQFIWAVLPAFEHEPHIPADLPYANDNPSFWQGSPVPQIPEAKFEIVCFDSSSTLFIGVDETIGEKLRMRYPDIRDLDEYNREGPSWARQDG